MNVAYSEEASLLLNNFRLSKIAVVTDRSHFYQVFLDLKEAPTRLTVSLFCVANSRFASALVYFGCHDQMLQPKRCFLRPIQPTLC